MVINHLQVLGWSSKYHVTRRGSKSTRLFSLCQALTNLAYIRIPTLDSIKAAEGEVGWDWDGGVTFGKKDQKPGKRWRPFSSDFSVKNPEKKWTNEMFPSKMKFVFFGLNWNLGGRITQSFYWEGTEKDFEKLSCEKWCLEIQIWEGKIYEKSVAFKDFGHFFPYILGVAWSNLATCTYCSCMGWFNHQLPFAVAPQYFLGLNLGTEPTWKR